MPAPLRFLIIEDSEDDAELIARELKRGGFQFVYHRVQTEAALEAALDLPAWDLIISDFNMPRFSGTTALRLLRGRGLDVPFVFVSGTIGEDVAVAAMKAGAQDYVTKGNLKRLVPAVERELREAEGRRERQRAEQSLRESEARYRLLFESNPHPMWVLDTETLRFLAVNAAAVQQYGYSREEFLGMTALDIRPEEDVEKFRHSMALPQEGVQLTAGWLHRKKDGTLIDVEVSAHAIPWGERPGLLSLVTDVTDRKRTVEALRDSEERFRQLAEHIKEAFFLTELQSGRTLYLSPTFEEIWGIPVAEVYRRPEVWFEGIHLEDRPAVGAALAEGRAGKATTTVFRVVRPDGTMRWARARSFPVPEANRLVGVVEDITEMRRVEEQATQAQKMEAVGRLAGGVAHDFNNLLTVILGEVELLIADLAPTSEFFTPLDEVRKAANRAAILTRQLLAFSRRQIIEPVVFDLNDLVKDMNKMLVRLIGEDIEVTTRLSKNPSFVRADRGQIEQVLANLAVNARDAMPRGGSLTLHTGAETLDEDYARSHAEVTPGEYVTLVVSDTGTGMTEEVKSRLFEPFFTTKECGKGTGLGLATSFGIVKQAGGHLSVYSEVGVGTTIRVYLPRLSTEQQPRSIVEAPALPRGDETILLVEDEASVRRVTARTLTSLGYRVLEAQSGEDAEALLASHEGILHLLFTDVVLPGIGGRDLADRVRATRPGIKLLFASGYTDDVILQHRLIEHDIALLQKPFTRESLAQKVRDVLDSA
jgi:PAS domain S-box-containing protein